MKIQGLVLIWDYKGNPIHDKITKFKYVFSEEEDDYCEIQIESGDALLADTPAYQEGQELTVQWGWAGDNNKMSKIRKVYIFDTFPSYEETVQLKIVCHEKFVIAKMDVAVNRNETTLKKGTPLILSSSVLNALNLTLDQGNPELQKLLTENNIKVKYNKIQSKKYQEESRVVSYFNGNMSTFHSLRTFLNKLPGGPYIIESRDDNVNIKTRDLAQPAIRRWTYKGGNEELIEFKPEKKTRSKASRSHSVGVTNWHPSQKEAITQESRYDDAGQIKISNSQINSDWYKLFGAGSPLQYAPTYGKSPTTPSRAATGVLATLGGRGIDPNRKFRKIYTGEDFGLRQTTPTSVGVSTTAVAKPMFQFVEDFEAPKETVLSPEHDSTKALAEADNGRKNAEVRNEKGTAKMLGEPSIECGMIVTFDGVAKKDEGNYYIFTCEHTIDDGGYILELSEIGRQGVNKKTVQPAVKTIEAINNPFPQYDPYQFQRKFDYGNKNRVGPRFKKLGSTLDEAPLVPNSDDIYINESRGPERKDNTRVVIPKIKKAQ